MAKSIPLAQVNEEKARKVESNAKKRQEAYTREYNYCQRVVAEMQVENPNKKLISRWTLSGITRRIAALNKSLNGLNA